MKYNELPLLPDVIAKTVCAQEYKMQEYSSGVRTPEYIERVEPLRKAMTPEQVEEFAKDCDKRCEEAFNAKCKWFQDCIKAKGNRGRDQLYLWIRHWMVTYLLKGKMR